MVGVDRKIELWSKVVYEEEELSDNELALMAESILGVTSIKEREEA